MAVRGPGTVRPVSAVVGQCRQVLAAVVREGDWVVDATVGHGHDTLFLCGLVGERGGVLGLDVQDSALESARQRVHAAGLGGRVRWACASHATLAACVPPPWRGQVKAVVFNLGYLPGAKTGVRTAAASTLCALESAWSVLAVGGVLAVVAYTGHEGGAEEAEAVRNWMAGRQAACCPQPKVPEPALFVAFQRG